MKLLEFAIIAFRIIRSPEIYPDTTLEALKEKDELLIDLASLVEDKPTYLEHIEDDKKLEFKHWTDCFKESEI